MTNPTDPRIEAAARALCDATGYDPDKDYITPVNNPEMDVNWKVYAPDAEIALKAADEAAWLPIESAPKGVNGISWMQLARVDGEETFTWSGMYCRGKFYAAGVFCSSGEVPLEFRQHEVHPTHWRQDPAGPKP